ncbi:F-box associated domain type 3, partial [Arabidopsis thaliana x Arabidopsis arenosa]
MKRNERDCNNENDEENEKDTNPCKLDLDSLPLDLKMVILARLPAKSLMKLRRVSKIWSSIIRSRGFINSFYSISSKQSRFIVALSNSVFGKPAEKLTFFFSFSHDDEDDSSSLLPNFEMAIPKCSFSNYSDSLASFHGILAVQADSKWLMCNPSTEQFYKLPATTAFVGYDPIDDQYKALSWKRIRYDSSGHLEHKVLTLADGEVWRHIKDTPLPYRATHQASVCINGFLYYAAFLTQSKDMDHMVLVCFDVRSEKLSFINAPKDVVQWGRKAVFIEYKGKLASIVRGPYDRFHSFDLWILEDVEKHEWSKQTCVFPSSVWDDVECGKMYFPGTNKAGEIIMAPKRLSSDFRPFYIFYYNVETKNIRRVRLLGIGDSEEFRRSYGFQSTAGSRHSLVLIAHQHVESVGFFKDPRINLT